MSNQEIHSISFDVAADDGQRVTAIVTMSADDTVIDVAAKDLDGNEMELSKKDRDILQNYAMLMVNSARKKIHERQSKEPN
jgi:DNA-binding protein YbaB